MLAELQTALQDLVNKYHALRKERGESALEDLSEANVRKDFVDPLFKALGWKTDDSHEYDAEKYVRGVGFADVAVKAEGKPIIFIEVKRFGHVPSRTDRGVQTTLSGYKIYADWTTEERQVLNYAGMSVGVKWAILTNFERFRLFNARTGVTILDIERPGDYIDRLDELILLTKNNVAVGNIDKLESRKELPEIDIDFLNLLNDWRLKLSRNIFTKCHGMELRKIKHVVQRILDRLIVIRYAEDRWVLEDTDQLKSTYETWLRTRTYQKLKLTGLLKGIFDGFEDIHDSKIFAPDSEVDYVLERIDSEVLGDIIVQLYHQSFRKFTSDILGNTYENYLGHELVLEDGTLQIRQNEQLRKSGGIYYTPPYVVDYIVTRTVGIRLEKLWKETQILFKEEKYREGYSRFKEIKNLRILDPACGSGSFLIRTFHLIKSYYEKFNGLVESANNDINRKILDMRKEGNHKDAWLLEGARLPKLESYEKDILHNNIFGVDIDPEAAEIASVNLVLQALKKSEKLPLILDQNIMVGNSLLSPRDGELGEFFSDTSAKTPFDWEEKFPEVFAAGGFDIVLGNPPHGGSLTKEDRDFFGEKFEIAKGYRNTASLFIERAHKILGENGLLGFVIPKSLTFSEKWKQARSFIKGRMLLLEIADISKAFPKVLLEQVVILAAKSEEKRATYLGTKLFRKEPIVSYDVPFSLSENIDGFPVHIGDVEQRIFDRTEEKCDKMGIISHTFRGLPIQNKTDEQRDRNKVSLLRGDDIKPYYMGEPKTFVKISEIDRENEKIQEMSRPKIVSQRIVAHILNPKDHIIIMCTLDEKGVLNVDTVENTVIRDKKFDLRYVLSWMNSKFVSWYAYNFIFNKAVRTMDFDEYYVAKIPIIQADKATQDKVGRMVDKLLGLTRSYFSSRPSFESYLNKLPRTFSKRFAQIYYEAPLSRKQTNIPSITKGSLKRVKAETSDKELIVTIRYADEEGKEIENEILRMVVDDPLYRQFLAESINISSFSKSKGNLLEKVLDVTIPIFESNAADNLEITRRFMKEYMKDVTLLREATENIQSIMSEIDQVIYALIGLSDDEISIIEEQVSDGIYSDRS